VGKKKSVEKWIFAWWSVASCITFLLLVFICAVVGSSMSGNVAGIISSLLVIPISTVYRFLSKPSPPSVCFCLAIIYRN